MSVGFSFGNPVKNGQIGAKEYLECITTYEQPYTPRNTPISKFDLLGRTVLVIGVSRSTSPTVAKQVMTRYPRKLIDIV